MRNAALLPGRRPLWHIDKNQEASRTTQPNRRATRKRSQSPHTLTEARQVYPMTIEQLSGPWQVVHDQFIRHNAGAPVAMAETPGRARELVSLLNAQAAGDSLAGQRFDQRLADVREEFRRRLAIADRRATLAQSTGTQAAEVDRMCDALRLIDRHGCTRNTAGRCWDGGYQRGARYSAEAWCDACIAADALLGIDASRTDPAGSTR